MGEIGFRKRLYVIAIFRLIIFGKPSLFHLTADIRILPHSIRNYRVLLLAPGNDTGAKAVHGPGHLQQKKEPNPDGRPKDRHFPWLPIHPPFPLPPLPFYFSPPLYLPPAGRWPYTMTTSLVSVTRDLGPVFIGMGRPALASTGCEFL